MRAEGPGREGAAARGEDARGATGQAPSGLDRTLLARPRLERRLDEALGRRLITIVGGPGSGKSTLLRTWAGRHPHAWHTASPADARLATLAGGLIAAFEGALGGSDALAGGVEASAASGALDETAERADAVAGYLCSVLDAALRDDLVLVIDDLHEVDGAGPSGQLVASLCRNAPSRLHVVLASREEVPFPIERLVANGEVSQLGARDLAFDASEIRALLEAGGLGGDEGLADAIERATNGWPAAVRLAIEAVRSNPDGAAEAVAGLARPDGPLFGYLAQEVFARGTPELRELIRTVAPLERFSPALCNALGIPDADATIRWLAARGLFLQRTGEELVLHGLVRDFARDAWPLEPGELRRILGAAAMWHAGAGQADVAVSLAERAGDPQALATLLADAGPELVRTGRGRIVADAAEQLPVASRSPAVARVVGEAYASMGMSDVALGWLELAAPPGGPVPIDIAWRQAMSHYLRDELQEVIRIYDEADRDPERPADVAQLAAWATGAYRRLGDGARASELAAEALRAAARTDDGSAIAAAHTAGAFAAEIAGDRVEVARHHSLALAAAQRAGDLLQTVRIRINSTSDPLESGSYADAIAGFDAAVEVATLAGFTSLRALALMNRGLSNWCLGRLEAASADYEASISAYRATGSRELAYAVIGRGDVYRERGDLELARVAYEEGLAIAERTGDRQALVPALYQSAKVLVSEDPDAALARAERAVAYLWPDQAWALVSLGWIRWLRGDRAGAHQAALDAAAAARAAGDRFGSAEALELRTWTAEHPAAQRDGLAQAARIWREIGNETREATCELALARLESGPSARAAADAAERRLERLGTRPSAFGGAGLLTAVARTDNDAVDIRTLGGFRMLRAGMPVALAEWQSKKSRDLLKLLIARRGRPAPREQLAEALWPDDPEGAVGNRLSVAVSLLRQVMDPDKHYDPEHFVPTDKENVTLNLDAVSLDVEEFLAAAQAGLALLRRGRTDEALDRLTAAEAAYDGDFLEEHPYDDWAVGLREEARASYLAIVGALADHARDAGDVEREIRLRLRLLERDPYDEAASLALVRAHLRRGARGEARAAYRRYTQRMEEIEVESVPFPSEAA
jgi:DNA-binding SARP family transcriptional activator